jgi:hypothetical protein
VRKLLQVKHNLHDECIFVEVVKEGVMVHDDAGNVATDAVQDQQGGHANDENHYNKFNSDGG